MIESYLTELNAALIIKLAVTVVGVTQWIKSLVQKFKIPTFVWAIVMSVLAIGVVVADIYCPIVNTILLVICVSQLGYEGIWQNMQKVFKRIINGRNGNIDRY